VISTDNMELTQELHVVRAHLLHYGNLLDDFRKSVVFVLENPHPGVGVGVDGDITGAGDVRNGGDGRLMEKECGNLLSEIGRLENSRRIQDRRLKNVMNLVGFCSFWGDGGVAGCCGVLACLPGFSWFQLFSLFLEVCLVEDKEDAGSHFYFTFLWIRAYRHSATSTSRTANRCANWQKPLCGTVRQSSRFRILLWCSSRRRS
jgi:hypothetical protein